MALEYDGEMVVIDAGVLFPEEGMPGVDLVIPDITYLVENSHKLKAILVTHGHEDHIGALPFVLSELDVPVYSSRLTHGLISVKLRERGLLKDAPAQRGGAEHPLQSGAPGCRVLPRLPLDTGRHGHRAPHPVGHRRAYGRLQDRPYARRRQAVRARPAGPLRRRGGGADVLRLDLRRGRGDTPRPSRWWATRSTGSSPAPRAAS